jgi:hypothetical protein
MGQHHTDPNEPHLMETEPAVLAEAARILLVVIVSAGWLTISDQTITWVVSVVGLAASVALTGWTRRTVTPLAQPRSASGLPLVPVSKSN